jgi:hypothetical protein
MRSKWFCSDSKFNLLEALRKPSGRRWSAILPLQRSLTPFVRCKYNKKTEPYTGNHDASAQLTNTCYSPRTLAPACTAHPARVLLKVWPYITVLLKVRVTRSRYPTPLMEPESSSHHCSYTEPYPHTPFIILQGKPPPSCAGTHRTWVLRTLYINISPKYTSSNFVPRSKRPPYHLYKADNVMYV